MNGILRIAKWSATYETAESRSKITALQWVAIPAGCESDGYLALSARGQEGIIALGVFMALVQGYAGRYKVRDRTGAFVRSDGSAMSVANISALVRIDQAIVESAVALLTSSDVRWLEWVPSGHHPDVVRTSSGHHPDTIRTSPDSGGAIDGQSPEIIQTTVQYSTVQDQTGPDTTPHHTTPREGAGRESEEVDGVAIEKAIQGYCMAASKRFSSEALKAAVEEIREGRVTQADLIDRLRLIAAEARRNPRQEKAYLPSPQRLIAEGQYLSDPASFLSAKSPDSGTVGVTTMPKTEEFYD